MNSVKPAKAKPYVADIRYKKYLSFLISLQRRIKPRVVNNPVKTNAIKWPLSFLNVLCISSKSSSFAIEYLMILIVNVFFSSGLLVGYTLNVASPSATPVILIERPALVALMILVSLVSTWNDVSVAFLGEYDGPIYRFVPFVRSASEPGEILKSVMITGLTSNSIDLVKAGFLLENAVTTTLPYLRYPRTLPSWSTFATRGSLLRNVIDLSVGSPSQLTSI